jgi:hypothetical protein
MTTPKPLTATARSLARNRRAARVLPPVTLDDEHAQMLTEILADTGEKASAWVRRMIREQTAQEKAPPKRG